MKKSYWRTGFAIYLHRPYGLVASTSSETFTTRYPSQCVRVNVKNKRLFLHTFYHKTHTTLRISTHFNQVLSVSYKNIFEKKNDISFNRENKKKMLSQIETSELVRREFRRLKGKSF